MKNIIADGVMTGHTHEAGNVPSLFQSIYYFLWGLEKVLGTHYFDVMTRIVVAMPPHLIHFKKTSFPAATLKMGCAHKFCDVKLNEVLYLRHISLFFMSNPLGSLEGLT